MVDDDPTLRFHLKGILERNGHEVEECADGDVVLGRLFAGDLPQIIFLDVDMPKVNGLEACRAIRNRVRTPYTHVILVTSKGDRQDLLEGLRFGANDYITKPVAVEEFRSRLDAAVKMVELHNLVEIQRVRLAAASRMALVGQLAAGVAHEVNTPLAAVITGLELLKLPGHRTPANTLDKILSSANKIGAIVTALRDLAGEDDGSPRVFTPVRGILDSILPLCEERISQAEVTLAISPDLPASPVFVQKMRIGQVILELLLQALRSAGGAVDPVIRIDGHEDSDGVQLAIEDNGPDDRGDRRSRLDRPFSSARDADSESGWSLEISKGIVRHNKGRLALDPSTPFNRYVLSMPKRP